ncbi:hypothetical protein DFJ63DRAFT_334986 [Scheffersomyces coipomensis]|uniref:uncharacterized protein n=1 Tax=Scheffersomyces coipomensis TaxID=1788519 RepID=UPI00315D7640
MSSITTLRVAYIPEHFSTPLFLAKQKGYYEQNNLNIEFVKVLEGTGRLVKLLNDGEVDIAIGLTEGFVADLASDKNQGNYKLIDTYVNSPLLWSISTGSQRDELKEVTDLNSDSSIGVSRIGSGSYVMSFVLSHDLKYTKSFSKFPILSNFKNLRDSVNHKLSNDENSDAFMWEYFTSKKYYDNNEIKPIGQIYTPWPSWVITVSSKQVETNPEPIKKFLNAINQGIQYFNHHQDEAIEYIYTNLDYSKEDASEWIKTVKFNTDLGLFKLNRDAVVEKTSQILKLAGVLKDNDETINSRLTGSVIVKEI